MTVVTWCDTVAVISQYHWITIVLHRQFVFKMFQIKLGKKDKPSAELLQQMDSMSSRYLTGYVLYKCSQVDGGRFTSVFFTISQVYV